MAHFQLIIPAVISVPEWNLAGIAALTGIAIGILVGCCLRAVLETSTFRQLLGDEYAI